MPVELEDFAVESSRRVWIDEKGAMVLQLDSDEHPQTRIDLFLELPLDFEQAFERRCTREAATGIEVSFVGLDDLIEMKRKAGRPQDQLDAQKLEDLRDQGRGGRRPGD